MELYYIITILDRDKSDKMISIFKDMKFTPIITTFGYGTATSEHLLLHDLQRNEKAVLTAVATRISTIELFKTAREQMYIDIPGNGIIMSVPLKSVCGGKSLSYLTNGQQLGGSKPSMEFKHELIITIISEGHSDAVMDVARGAGATGGTVIHAKGTGTDDNEKFLGVSLAKNKELIYILSPADKKTNIMQSITANCGKNHPAEAICFSLPVCAVCGIREEKQGDLSL